MPSPASVPPGSATAPSAPRSATARGSTCPRLAARRRRTVRAAGSARCRGMPSGGRCTTGWSTCRGCCSFYDEGEPLPDPVLARPGHALDAHYRAELGEPFRTAGLCLYRDGRDSVAWHGDTIGRGSTHDTMVAIISVGAPRALLLRPHGGGGGDRAVRARSRRPDRDGRQLPAHLGARRAQDRAAGRARGSASSSAPAGSADPPTVRRPGTAVRRRCRYGRGR